MERIPLQNIPSQTFSVVLDDQYCTISIYWKQEYLYLDLWVNDILIRQGAICQNLADVLQGSATGFSGSLHFYDLEGDRRPSYDALDSRYIFIYVPESEEIPALLEF